MAAGAVGNGGGVGGKEAEGKVVAGGAGCGGRGCERGANGLPAANADAAAADIPAASAPALAESTPPSPWPSPMLLPSPGPTPTPVLLPPTCVPLPPTPTLFPEKVTLSVGYYLQTDPRFYKINDKEINTADSGCGPAALTMLLNYHGKEQKMEPVIQRLMAIPPEEGGYDPGMFPEPGLHVSGCVGTGRLGMQPSGICGRRLDSG